MTVPTPPSPPPQSAPLPLPLPSSARPAGRPWVIGHRGIPARLPESTLAGFGLAFDLGADAVELDVHATRDGVVVVHHDAVLPDGRPIALHDLEELHASDGVRERMPALRDVLALAAGRGAVFVEIKGSGIEQRVADEIRRSAAPCAVHSFDHRAPARTGSLAPGVPTGILLASYLMDTPHAMRAAAAGTLWQERSFVDAHLVRQVHLNGGSVVAWTVNEPDEVRRLARLGVDGICTDDVAMARDALEEPRPS